MVEVVQIGLGRVKLSYVLLMFYPFEMNEISEAQYELIRPHLPVQRGNVRISSLTMINAVLYVAENGCKWRALPPKFGNWHTIYTRLRRWAEADVLDRLFTALREHRLIRIRVECPGLDSTLVKVHPDGTGASKKGAASHWEISWRMEHQDPSGCRGCSNSPDIQSFRRPGP